MEDTPPWRSRASARVARYTWTKPVCLVVQTVEHYAAEHLDQAHDVNAGVGELLQWIVREVEWSFFLQEQVVLYGAPQSFDVLAGVEGPEAAPSKLAVFGGEG